MLIIDGHLDHAWNALQWNHDLVSSVYTIRVHEWGFDQTMAYRVFLQRYLRPLNDTPIPFGQVLTGDVAFPEELDFYTFSGVSGQTVRIQVTKQSGAGGPHFEVFDPSGVQVAEFAAKRKVDGLL